MIAESNRRDPLGPSVGVAVGDEDEMLVAEPGEALAHPVEQAADIVIRQARP